MAMNNTHKRHKGFGLIEILVTLGILSIGILGVATLHGVITRQSQDNKARAEAISIAQSRIEEMRNYTNSANSQILFDALFPDTAGFANSATVNGINAVFTRTESITSAARTKPLAVRVAWTDPEGNASNVTLNSELSYIAPRSIGDTALGAALALVNAPTGRARLGEGQLPEGAVTTPNNDGTSLFTDGGTDLMLVSDDQIVLTLAMACQTEDGECIDFVKIKGTIYIDNGSQNNLKPGEVFVVASDAAFCARYYHDAQGTLVKVTANTTTARTTPSGNYKYFHYTCYIGGGWHGNVGIILAGGSKQSDKICVGDPVTENAWELPVIASRRVYRGMLFKHDLGNTPGLKEEYTDTVGNTQVRYYSQGIGDSVQLPAPDSEDNGHDFVIGSAQASATAGSNCITEGIMMRNDSDANNDGTKGDLFAGNPADFICLNDGLLDNYDTDKFGHALTCPYNPAVPPSTRYLISGAIYVTAPQDSVNDLLMNSLNAMTSDGPGNCTVTPWAYSGTQYAVSYACDIYIWGTGWNGYLQAIYDYSAISCTPNRITKTNVTGNNSSGNNFTNCSLGSYAVFRGVVTAGGNRRLTAVSITGGGSCTLATDGLSYQCISHNLSPGTYTGTLTFTPSGGEACGSPATKTNVAAGFHAHNVTIANNAGQC
jgi:prepilin-type N-terminal cleavage/methylation domain-containing protein